MSESSKLNFETSRNQGLNLDQLKKWFKARNFKSLKRKKRFFVGETEG